MVAEAAAAAVAEAEAEASMRAQAEEAAAQQTKVESGVKFLKRRADLTREALEAEGLPADQPVKYAHENEGDRGKAVAKPAIERAGYQLQRVGGKKGKKSAPRPPAAPKPPGPRPSGCSLSLIHI